jgi:hypothetical protein
VAQPQAGNVASRAITIQELYEDHVKLVNAFNELTKALADERQAGRAIGANTVSAGPVKAGDILTNVLNNTLPAVSQALTQRAVGGGQNYFEDAGKLMFEEFLKSLRLKPPGTA